MKKTALSLGTYFDSYKKERKQKKDKLRFEEKLKDLNMSEEKRTQLQNLIENEYQSSSGLKSREEVFDEERKFSREYREFLNYASTKPANFIAKTVHEIVNEMYRRNEGKKSVARIFAELKSSRYFSVGFRYNEKENRYEANVNNSSVDNRIEAKVNNSSIDIRKLMLRDLHRNINFAKYGYTYKDYINGSINSDAKQDIKKKIIDALDYYTHEYAKDLKKLGIDISYKGVDRVLEERYHLSEASHYALSKRNQQPSKKYESLPNRELEFSK